MNPRPTTVEIAPEEAGDAALVQAITALANEVYAVAEAGFWRPGVRRTSADEIAASIADGQIITAYLDDQLVGLVRLSVQSQEATFGMLAVHPQARGAGIGLRLVEAAEDAGQKAGAQWMRIEVVTPTEQPDASKAGLGRWYQSLGYDHAGRVGVTEHYPAMEADLAIPCHLEIYRKPLTT